MEKNEISSWTTIYRYLLNANNNTKHSTTGYVPNDINKIIRVLLEHGNDVKCRNSNFFYKNRNRSGIACMQYIDFTLNNI